MYVHHIESGIALLAILRLYILTFIIINILEQNLLKKKLSLTPKTQYRILGILSISYKIIYVLRVPLLGRSMNKNQNSKYDTDVL